MIEDLKNQDKQEVKAVAPIRKSTTLMRKLRPQRGQICFELDMNTGVVQPAEIKSQSVNLSGKVSKDIVVRKGCLYILAINKKNAFRKFKNAIDAVVDLNKSPKTES